jgi:hypothetical protein
VPARGGERRGLLVVLVGGLVCALLIAGGALWSSHHGSSSSSATTVSASNRGGSSTSPKASTTTGHGSSSTAATTTTTTPLGPYDGWVNPASSGRPWPDAKTVGMLTFRGNPTRSYYGQGPVPVTPQVLYRFPATKNMCKSSSALGVTKVWCGMGWTGQPLVWERPDGTTWVIINAYDGAFHFLDANTGKEVMPPLQTGDLAKGSDTLDPDGYPLMYAGSRDNYLRVIALDRGTPVVLWKLWAHDVSPTLWNDDWDGAAMVIGDYLFEGGENSQFHIVKLNRGYDATGKVTVNPQLVFHTPGWDAQELKDIGDQDVSIENSVAVSGNTVYFANSGGLVQGWDISGLKQGKAPTRVFRFWTGDDTDASVVVDADGYLYVNSEFQRFNDRAKTVGQIMKLDPRKPDNPLVWSVKDQGYRGAEDAAGVWATSALYQGVDITATNGGRVLGIDMQTGQVLWTIKMSPPTWMSPVPIDGTLIEGDCGGNLKGFDLSNPRVQPPEIWTMKFAGCLEATPTVWKNRIYLGSRDGGFYALGPGDGSGKNGSAVAVTPTSAPPTSG